MKIYVWGTGQLFRIYGELLIRQEDIVGFIDNDTCKEVFWGKKVYSPKDIVNKEYDAILVVVGQQAAKEVYEQCLEIFLDTRKIIFICNNFVLTDLNTDYDLVGKVLGEEYIDKIRHSSRLLGTNVFEWENFQHYRNDKVFKNDYTRYKTLELMAEELERSDIQGCIAELGVFRGDFAKYIRKFMPDRKMYLFDTFDSFGESEAKNEVQEGNISVTLPEVFKNTSVDLVLENIGDISKVHVEEGLFPDSLGELEEEFAFVSIDVDLGESIYQGLCYFYPRMVRGGVIFVHDYNTRFRGVRIAVERYEKAVGKQLLKLPLSDLGGTLVIIKGDENKDISDCCRNQLS